MNASEALGIKLPYIVLVVKNLKKYFTFEVQIKDDKNITRRFRASNYQSSKKKVLIKKTVIILDLYRNGNF